MLRSIFLLALWSVVFLVPRSAFATEYKFTVTCTSGAFVVHWKTGDIDPGKEWLRVATGTENPNCSVSEFRPQADAGLRVESRSHEEGVVRGIPLVGPIICAIFSC